MGLTLGLGEIPMRLRTMATPAGAVTFLKALSRPSMSPPPVQRAKPQFQLAGLGSGGATASFHLLGGAVQVARGVPCWQLESGFGRYLEREPLGRNVHRCDISLTALSLGLVRSCYPLTTTSSWRQEWTVR